MFWLHNVPEWTSIFARLVILIVVVDSLSGCVIPAIQAKGKIKWYQINVGLTKLFNLPITYLLFKLGFSPSYAMIVSIVLNFICLFVRLRELKKHLGIGYMEYIKEVVMYDMGVTLLSCIIPTILYVYLSQSLISFFIVCITSLVCTIISILYVGLKKDERSKIMYLVKNKIKK